MVVDIAGLDGGQIRDEHAGVEGGQLDDLPGQQTVAVQMIGQPHDEFRQTRHGEHELGELVGAVGLVLRPIRGNCVGNFLIHGKHCVVLVQIHLQRGLVDYPVGLFFQDHEGHAEVVAAVNAAVHDEVVQLGIAQHRLVIGGDDDAHMVQPHPSPAVGADEVLDDLLIDVLGDGVPGVVALGHDIGNGRHQRRQVLYAGSIRAHGKALLFR